MHYTELRTKVEGYSLTEIDSARTELRDKYKLFNITNQDILLSAEGERYKSFKQYLRTKNRRFTPYQISYLTFFVLFGLFGAYQTFFATPSLKEFNSLKNDVISLRTQLDLLSAEYDSVLSRLDSLISSSIQDPKKETISP
ncbi:hypothetical protein J0X14_14125 [Muricauda sp. CAU 1633]|nr:hypothetical protein [Muricauda sp. CAU 1633]